MIEADGRTVKSVETAWRIVECLRKKDCDSVTAVAQELELSVGTVHTHLATLKQFGLVAHEGDRYSLGPQFVTMGEFVRNESPLYNAAKDEIDALAKETGEAAHLIIEHQGRLYALYERFGSNAVGVTYHTQKRQNALRHLHCTAAGKAILAHVADDMLINILNRHGLPELTTQSITNIEALVEELEQIKEEGIAYADEEQMEGLRAVGTPVHSPDDEVVGAIALSGPVSRLKGDRFRITFANMVRDAAQVTELTLQTEEVAGLA